MATLVKKTSLADLVLKQGLLSSDQWEELTREAHQSRRSVQTALLTSALLTDQTRAQLLAEVYGLPYEPLLDFRVDFEAFPEISPQWMTEHCFAPFRELDGVLTVALADPQDLPRLDRIEKLLARRFRVVVAPRPAILDAVKASERNSQVMARVRDEFRPILIHENDDGEEVLSVEKINRDQSPVVRLVDTIILSALQKRASDIHIEPAEGITEIKYRVDGVLYAAMEPLDMRFHGPLVSRIKVMSDLDIAERRTPQDGRFKLRLEKRTVDFRVSVLPSAYGESVVIRILAKEEFTSGQQGLSLEALGLKQEDLRRLRRASTASYGMILVTGPTGSGKTTTLYAAINEVNTKEDKIITIEDPVEYQLRGVVQIPVNEKKGLTFARGLRSILRHDPDKIMVGEIRDAETAQIAIQSALTGHLVFTSVHANNAFDVIGRFVNMGIEPYNFVAALNCIMAQRLVRTLCPVCKVPASISPAQCEEMGVDYEIFKGQVVYEGKGCHECHDVGYRGRQAITEFLAVTDPIKELILDRRPTAEIRAAAVASGMTSLREAGLEKVLQGYTTLREVNRVTFTG